MNNYQEISRIRTFLKRLKIPVQVVNGLTPQPEPIWSPGVWIDQGRLFICPKHAIAGNVLHEAGHMISLPRSAWKDIKPGDLSEQDLGEVSLPLYGDLFAEAWAFAVSIELDLPLGSSVKGLPIYSMGDDEELIKDDGQPSDIPGLSRVQAALWAKLASNKHMGVALLSVLGLSSLNDFPKMRSWFPTREIPPELARLALEEAANE